MIKKLTTENRQRAQADHEGIVSLITAIIVGLLLIVITTSGIALMGNELRQASDYDNSIKAYYAAESGTEDAIAQLRRNGIAAKNSCSPYVAGDANLSGDSTATVSYTCQVVNT